MKKAFIVDLDNTVFPVPSIGEKLFAPLFSLLENSGQKRMDEIRNDVMRKPFQWVASHYGLSDELKSQAIELLKTLEHKGPLTPFPDFAVLNSIQVDKFLVTTGFMRMQQSKISALQLNDFREKIVIDPTTDSRTKKDVFRQILSDNSYSPQEVLVIGDDAESEIRAGVELGIDTVLYDPDRKHSNTAGTYVVANYNELKKTDFLR
jgi:putative hydrolase of the HAD superfamily